jgi:fumarylacetoacetate (FAA) hydrolase
MKFVTYHSSDTANFGVTASEKFRLEREKFFSPWTAPQRHPLSPKGRLGMLADGIVIDVEAASLQFQMRQNVMSPKILPAHIITFLTLGDEALDLAAQVFAWATSKRPDQLNSPSKFVYNLDEVTLLAPVPRPTSMRDGYAFRQHVEAARRNRGVEMIPEFDKFPVFYFTNHQAVIGPGPLEVMPMHLDKLDFELEAAIVIGKEGRNISAKNADDHIFGYMVMNDWSARTLQMEEMKLSLGPAKGKDFATAIGPYLVTKDELADKRIPSDTGDRYDLEMTCHIDGELISRGNLKDMSWTFAEIIERASYGVTLYPGDVIGSGTVGTGCFLELNGSKVYDNRWVKPGEVVTCSIERLGDLTNTVAAAKL